MLTTYDPREHGARCERCPLGGELGSAPVPPEEYPGARMLCVAEYPGRDEVLLGRPLIGQSGQEFMKALAFAGLSRESVSLTNAVLCKPTHHKSFGAFLADVRKRNKVRVAGGIEPFLMPIDACLPRLLREFRRAPALLLMGKTARQTIDREGGEEGLMLSRGYPGTLHLPATPEFPAKQLPVLATVNPAFVIRTRRWTHFFRGDVKKAARMAQGRLVRMEVTYRYFPRPRELYELLKAMRASGKLISYDVETRPGVVDDKGKGVFDPLTDVLRCIGIGTDVLATCVPFESVEGKQYYNAEEKAQVLQILRAFFSDPAHLVCGHNEGVYDRTVMAKHGIPVGNRVFDTVLAHHIVWSELPHSLEFLTSQYTDEELHKNVDHDRWDSDRELHKYCMKDVAVTSRCASILVSDARLQEQARAYQADTFLSRLCREMHAVGMEVDLLERDRHARSLGLEMEQYREDARRLALAALEGRNAVTRATRKLAEELNPGSDQQVAKLLYGAFGVAPLGEDTGGVTETGEPSVKKEVLYQLIDSGLPTTVEQFLEAIIDYDEAQKLRGTFTSIQAAADGRVHPTWNPHVVVSGRLSCSNPNLQNIRKGLRTMYTARAGHLLIQCDKAQLEARVLAWLAHQQDQIEAFLSGADIHKVNACAVLGIKDVDRVTKAERQFCKTLIYAAQYLASVRKVHRMIRGFMDPKTGERPWRTLPFEKTQAAFKSLWKARGAIDVFHQNNRDLWAKQGFLADYIHGRRRYFLDGDVAADVREELANFLIQSSSAADVNDATERVVAEFPWGFDGPYTGVVHQGHDALLVECKAHHAEKVGRRVQQCMNSKLGEMPLPVDLAIGFVWGDMKEVA